jgi:hypothetical protein
MPSAARHQPTSKDPRRQHALKRATHQRPVLSLPPPSRHQVTVLFANQPQGEGKRLEIRVYLVVGTTGTLLGSRPLEAPPSPVSTGPYYSLRVLGEPLPIEQGMRIALVRGGGDDNHHLDHNHDD